MSAGIVTQPNLSRLWPIDDRKDLVDRGDEWAVEAGVVACLSSECRCQLTFRVGM